jgi:hypothetical protein
MIQLLDGLPWRESMVLAIVWSTGLLVFGVLLMMLLRRSRET